MRPRGPSGPKVAIPIMVARQVDTAVMSLDKGKQISVGLKTENMAVKHDARVFTGMMMRVRCVYRIKIRSREVLQTPNFQAPSWLDTELLPSSRFCPWQIRLSKTENRKNGGKT